MSQRQKLLARIKSKPKNFSWSELERLLESLGYVQETGSGSRRKFWNQETGALITLHEPHPISTLKDYQVKEILNHFKERGIL